MDIEQLAAEMRKGFEAINGRMDSMEIRLVTHMDKVETKLLDRIEFMEKRVVLQGGKLQGGSRIIARISDWSEDTDTELLRHAARITELEKQVENLQKRLESK